MFAKLLVTTLVLVAVAATLLFLRQQRLELTHAVMDANRQVREIQQATWRQQADAARLLAPHRLIDSIDRTQIAVEPTKPLRGSIPETRVVEADDDPPHLIRQTRHMP